jgi:hypothetical protein
MGKPKNSAISTVVTDATMRQVTDLTRCLL